jgi:hypothetical protein
MSPFKAILPVIAGLFLSAAAFAADSPAPPPAYGPGFGFGGCHGIMRFLTPEEHIMHFQEMHKDVGNMTVNQFWAWRKTQCDRLAAMTPVERQKYAANLKAKWDALPDSEKVRLYHEALTLRDGMGHGHAPGHGHGRGMGHGG